MSVNSNTVILTLLRPLSQICHLSLSVFENLGCDFLQFSNNGGYKKSLISLPNSKKILRVVWGLLDQQGRLIGPQKFKWVQGIPSDETWGGGVQEVKKGFWILDRDTWGRNLITLIILYASWWHTTTYCLLASLSAVPHNAGYSFPLTSFELIITGTGPFHLQMSVAEALCKWSSVPQVMWDRETLEMG